MKIAYGYTIDSDDDKFLDIVEEGNALSDRFAAPGRWLVDYYPIRKFPLLTAVSPFTDI